MQIRTFVLAPRSRAANVALLTAVVALGAVFVVFGLALLLALAAVGTVAGVATLAWRRLTGQAHPPAPPARAVSLDPWGEIPASAAHARADRVERAEWAETVEPPHRLPRVTDA